MIAPPERQREQSFIQVAHFPPRAGEEVGDKREIAAVPGSLVNVLDVGLQRRKQKPARYVGNEKAVKPLPDIVARASGS